MTDTITFEAVAHINNSPEEVMNYISDVRNRPLFTSALKSIDNIEGDPAGEGATWTWQWLSLGMVFEGTARCTKKEAGRLYSFESEGGIKSAWTYTAQAKDGGTELEVHVDWEMPESFLSHLTTDDALAKLRDTEVESAIANLKIVLDK
jgi:uncharacterized membrane protein